MATRVYFSDTAASPVTPPSAGAEWEHNKGLVRKLLLAPDSSALFTDAYTPDAADHGADEDALHRRFVSDYLAAQTLSGNVSGQFQCLEDHANNNQFLTLKISVISNDGATTRATLLSIARAASELDTVLTNRSFSSTALSSYTCVAGDRLLVEVGIGGSPGGGPGTQGHNGSIRWGCSATSGDLPVDETTTVTTYRPWVEFSSTFSFAPLTVTKTVKPSGGDYSSLSAWEAGEQGDLVTADEIRQAECYAMSDTTAVTIDGSTTDATRYLRIYTPASERHDGKWNASKYRMEVTDSSGIQLMDEFIYLDGLQVKITISASAVHHKWAISFHHNYSTTSAAKQYCSNTISVIDTSAGSDNLGFGGFVVHDAVSDGGKTYVWNCVAYGARERGGYGDLWGWGFTCQTNGYLYTYNCTAYDCDTGFYVSGTPKEFISKNCLAQGCDDGFGGTFSTGTTYNCSDISSDAPGTNPVTGTVTFVDATNRDLHLASSDTVAKDAGTDLSADSVLSFSDDIDSQARSGTWDIGADEYVAAGGAGFPCPARHPMGPLLVR